MLFLVMGFILVSIGVVAGICFASRGAKSKGIAIAVCVISVLAGLTLLFRDSVEELAFAGVGSIRFARHEAETDLAEIKVMRGEIEKIRNASLDLQAVAESATGRITELESASQAANDIILHMSAIMDFMSTVAAAENDSRVAYDKLKSIAQDPSSAFKEDAEAAWKRIARQHSQPFYRSNLAVPWLPEVKPEDLSMRELSEGYSAASVDIRPALVEYIWKRQDLPLGQRMAFLADVIERDTSLQAVECAARYFAQGAELEAGPMEIERLLEWWDAHRSEYD